MTQEGSGAGVGRYRLNLALLVIVVCLVSYWFYLHFYPLFQAVTLAGGTLSLWGIWKFVQSILDWGTGKQVDSWARRRLGGADATELLFFSLAPLAVLYLTTASIYLHYAPDRSGASRFEVEVLHEGEPYLDLDPVSSAQRVRGRPYLLRWRPVDLELRIARPSGYRTLTRQLRPGRNLSVAVPADFDRIALIRLVPDLRLFRELPDPGESPEAHFRLTLRAGSGASAEEWELGDLRKGTVYTGSDRATLEALVRGQDAEAFRRELDDHLLQAGMTDEGFRAQLIVQLAGPEGLQLLPTGDLDPGTRVAVTGRSSAEGPCPRFGAEFEVPGGGSTTVFLKCR